MHSDLLFISYLRAWKINIHDKSVIRTYIMTSIFLDDKFETYKRQVIDITS